MRVAVNFDYDFGVEAGEICVVGADLNLTAEMPARLPKRPQNAPDGAFWLGGIATEFSGEICAHKTPPPLTPPRRGEGDVGALPSFGLTSCPVPGSASTCVPSKAS